MQQIKTICPYCGVGCGLAIKVRDASIVAIKGDKEPPSSLGGICPKGPQIDQIVATANRLTVAQTRSDRSQPFKAAPLDTVLQQVADKFKALLHQHGPDAIAFYVSGQLTIESQYAFNKLAKGALGTNNSDDNS